MLSATHQILPAGAVWVCVCELASVCKYELCMIVSQLVLCVCACVRQRHGGRSVQGTLADNRVFLFSALLNTNHFFQIKPRGMKIG